MDDAPVPVRPQKHVAQRFFEPVIKEIDKGYTKESTLRNESWELICSQLNREYFGGATRLTVPILKRNMRYHRMQYHHFSALLALDGVQWDVRTNEVKAEESVWEAYYKAHPNAPHYHHGGQRFYDLFCHVFESGVRFD